MDEDLELNRFVKGALEAKAPFSCELMIRPRRRWPWAAASLLAASVALVATLHLPGRGDPSPVEDALRLLSEAEGAEPEIGSVSSSELLLAWQEASFAEG